MTFSNQYSKKFIYDNFILQASYVKNKKYRLPDRYLNVKEGKILARGKDWLLCSTIEEGNAVLLYDLKLYGIVKQFLTKGFIKSLKSLK